MAFRTIDEVAAELGVSPRTVRRLIRERRIPYVRIRGSVRFDPTDLEAWIDDQRVPAENGR